MKCDWHKPIGGPHSAKVVCKKCGKEWVRYFAGSWDWQYKDCPKCRARATLYGREEKGKGV